MAITKLTEFSKTGPKNTDGLVLEAGFPSDQKPARQWFNWLFNSLAVKVNEIIDQLEQPENRIKSGMTVMWPSSTVPAGYLECAGQLVSRTTYAALFAVIGTSFGAGDGSTTFNVPDMRGEFARGWDHGRGIDAGRVLGSWQDEAFKSHNHTGSTGTAGAHAHQYDKVGTGGSGQTSGGSSSYNVQDNTASAGDHTHTVTINSNGGTETRPRNVAWMFIIKI